jgi:cell wall-associated NlpC family hydrolase
MSISDQYRNQVVSVAQEAVGAHYLHGSFGNHPSACNGHPARDSRLRLADNRYQDQAIGAITIHTAWTNVEGPKYCWGRPHNHQVAATPQVPAATLRNPAALRQLAESANLSGYRWPRTDNGRQGTVIFGEACEGKRHFDCIGFVNWVMFRIFGTQTIRDIAACRQYAQAEQREHPELAQALIRKQPGDIIIFSINHIGIAVSGQEMVEANGEYLGLIRGPIRQGTDVLRPTSSVLNGAWNVPLRAG